MPPIVPTVRQEAFEPVADQRAQRLDEELNPDRHGGGRCGGASTVGVAAGVSLAAISRARLSANSPTSWFATSLIEPGAAAVLRHRACELQIGGDVDARAAAVGSSTKSSLA